jgi:hypothetical protein
VYPHDLDGDSPPDLATECQVTRESAGYGIRIDRELVAFIESADRPPSASLSTYGKPRCTPLLRACGAVALGQARAGEAAISTWVQIAMANSSNATANRRLASSSAASS